MSLFSQIAESLGNRYASPQPETTESAWMRAVGRLLGTPFSDLAVEVRESSLGDPVSTAATSPGLIVEVLASVPRGRQKAGVVFLLAGWWQTEFAGQSDPDWVRSPDHYRSSLRAIRGLGPATVDDILMHAARINVFPLTRPVTRVGVRHGWIDLPMEEESIQAFFRNEADRSSIDLRTVSHWFEQIGEQYCGRIPQCETCPLKAFLPASGPCHSDEV